MFPGIHPHLVTSSVYNEVQLVLDGKRTNLRQQNHFLFQALSPLTERQRQEAGAELSDHVQL